MWKHGHPDVNQGFSQHGNRIVKTVNLCLIGLHFLAYILPDPHGYDSLNADAGLPTLS